MKNTIKLFMIAAAFFISGNLFAQSVQADNNSLTVQEETSVSALEQQLQAFKAHNPFTYTDELNVELLSLQIRLDNEQSSLSPAEIADINQQITDIQAKLTAMAAAEAELVAKQQASNPSHSIGATLDPNNPAMIPAFVPTGNEAQDAQLILNWLVQQGLVKP